MGKGAFCGNHRSWPSERLTYQRFRPAWLPNHTRTAMIHARWITTMSGRPFVAQASNAIDMPTWWPRMPSRFWVAFIWVNRATIGSARP